MKGIKIVALVVTSVGVGLLVYYGFIHKYGDGMTFFQRLTSDKKSGPVLPPPTQGSPEPVKPAPVIATDDVHEQPAAPKIEIPKKENDRSNIGRALYSTVDGLNIRKTPGTGQIIATAKKGQKVGYMKAGVGENTDFAAVANPAAPTQTGFVYRKYTTF